MRLDKASALLQIGQNWKNRNDVTISRHDVIFNFFRRCFFSLVKFSYWSEFHDIVIICCGVIAIFFYKGLTSNPENTNTPV